MKILEFILDLLYPKKCIFCGKILSGTDLCPECEAKLPYTKGDSIYQKFPFVKKCISPLYYKDIVRESILRYKFTGCSSYCVRYGDILSDCIENNLDCGGIDVITYVPISRRRMRKRGYNQSELIAAEASKRLELPCNALLKKIKDNPAQSSVNDRKKRTDNVSGVYKVINEELVKGKYILLVDDVVTTGSTISECARMLCKAGAKEVYCATIARHED